MKAEIDLEWHIHVGRFMITRYEEPHYSFNDTFYRVSTEFSSRGGFRTLEAAIEFAEKVSKKEKKEKRNVKV